MYHLFFVFPGGHTVCFDKKQTIDAINLAIYHAAYIPENVSVEVWKDGMRVYHQQGKLSK